MRTGLDTILNAINSVVLTDPEWVLAASILNGNTDTKHQYQALYEVLCTRGESGSVEMAALHAYFENLGCTPEDLKQKEFSNIFIGAVLD